MEISTIPWQLGEWLKAPEEMPQVGLLFPCWRIKFDPQYCIDKLNTTITWVEWTQTDQVARPNNKSKIVHQC